MASAGFALPLIGYCATASSCSPGAVLLEADIRDIIEEGNCDLLKRLLKGESAEELVLETKYGGSDDGPDLSGLYSGTSPLLHAARRGRIHIFSALMQYLEKGQKAHCV